MLHVNTSYIDEIHVYITEIDPLKIYSVPFFLYILSLSSIYIPIGYVLLILSRCGYGWIPRLSYKLVLIMPMHYNIDSTSVLVLKATNCTFA